MASSDKDKTLRPPRKKKKPRRYAGPMLKCQECGKEHMEQPCPRCPRLKTCQVCGYRYAIKCMNCKYKCKFCGMDCMCSSHLKVHLMLCTIDGRNTNAIYVRGDVVICGCIWKLTKRLQI